MAVIRITTLSQYTCAEVQISVLLPDRVKEDIPVLYLLHGGMGFDGDWLQQSNVARYANDKGIALIMPGAGASRWLKMAWGPDYEKYVTEELPELVARFFPSITKDPEKTYIGGLSMGGGGAMELGLMHPEQYAAICCLSTSSVIPLEHLRLGGITPPGPGGTLSLSMVQTGHDDPDELRGTRYDILWQSEENIRLGKKLPRIFHATGVQDHGIEVALAIRKHFLSLEGNPYRYEFFAENMTHCWEFWDAWILRFLETVG